nr:hypothetical protein [Tanacetum cinerariifolium]
MNVVLVPELDRNNLACLVKIYDTLESDLKLNDIGISQPLNLPSSKVPRLHCLVHKKLSVNDLISSSPTMEPKPDLLRGIRESLLRHLTVVLGDDELAAHFMLLHLLSKVHLRVDSVALEKLSLNLIGFDKSMKDYETNRFVSGALYSSFPSNNCGPIRKHRCGNVRCMEMVVEDDMVSARQVDRSLGTEDFNKFVIGRVLLLF